jgi:hypothetical protein
VKSLRSYVWNLSVYIYQYPTFISSKNEDESKVFVCGVLRLKSGGITNTFIPIILKYVRLYVGRLWQNVYYGTFKYKV